MTKHRFTDYQLSDEIIQALDQLNYDTPTDVQSKVILLAQQKKDLIVRSQTGSGKTAAYGIPICEFVDWQENKPQAIVLTPTRELAVQVKEDFINIGRYKRIKAAAIVGKQPFYKQKNELKQKTHVVVGTPGRMLDHIEKGTLSLEEVKYVVIDEADEMLNMGFIEQVEAIIEEMPTPRVTMLFSATLPERVKDLSVHYMNTPTDVEIKTSGVTTSSIDHTLYQVSEDDKYSLLEDVTIIENPDSAIIFCRTQERVNELCDQLADQGYDSDKIHGGMEQYDRLDVMEDFRRGEFRYLIATDVAARGIDIDQISHVINYDLPSEKESYVHRTGRTGRAGHTGKAISFVTPFEEKYLKDIETYIGFKISKSIAPSKEAVSKAKPQFLEKINSEPSTKEAKNDKLNENIMKLYFNGGKRKKLRAVDFVGTIAKIEGVTAEDIGIITIEETATFIEILNDKGHIVLDEMKHTTVKGKQLKVHIARNR
ncbi:DEAD/DEAH box helicase [Geomicrobium sp. JCM 19038]|uniref:DEAD/DEAH box helicase n=1 Tax=Geomicrobium sp. JCM 19038 TaxID=1460635 RepID=UPI00045F3019|nr:DEAD/DEAH box helicase [Geomicrobium sp. JCM 19038]GAK06751.1 ATP-dependent RNA helicase YxiN [Geomicrobium sp. JCM 19038]